MPASTHKTHTHRSGSHPGGSSRHTGSRQSYLQPVFYFSGMILLLIAAKLLHTSMLSPSIGSFGIILLAISKQWKFKPGVILSVISMFLMVIILDWKWVDRYFVAIMSGEISSKKFVFQDGLSDSFIVLFLVWIYERLLNSIHEHGGQRWFDKKTFVVIFKLLIFFLVFLLLFWLTAFVMYSIQSYTRLTGQDSALVAGAIALLATGIPVIIYFSKAAADARKRPIHRHHRKHRHPAVNDRQKISDFQ